jgi:hypothetical protein
MPLFTLVRGSMEFSEVCYSLATLLHMGLLAVYNPQISWIIHAIFLRGDRLITPLSGFYFFPNPRAVPSVCGSPHCGRAALLAHNTLESCLAHTGAWAIGPRQSGVIISCCGCVSSGVRVLPTSATNGEIRILRTSSVRSSEKFFVANLATAAATHSSRQDGGNTIAEESPTRSVLEPLIGRTRG